MKYIYTQKQIKNKQIFSNPMIMIEFILLLEEIFAVSTSRFVNLQRTE